MQHKELLYTKTNNPTENPILRGQVTRTHNFTEEENQMVNKPIKPIDFRELLIQKERLPYFHQINKN